jgi:hypothetical protein
MSNSNRLRRNLPSSSSLRATLLVLAVVVLAVAPGLPLVAQEKTQGGLDFFRTATGSKFNFSGDFAIPAGFFGQGYDSFTGSVAFKGVPLGTYRDHKTGRADTVVERKATPPPSVKYPNESKSEIQLAALSLASTQPIKVRAGGKTELWDVKVQTSPSRPSTGTMMFTQRNKRGGVAQSELTVYPVFTFVRRGDKAEKTLDTGTLKLGCEGEKRLTLRASNIPWTRQGSGIVVGSNQRPAYHLNEWHTHPILAVVVQTPTNVR